MSTLEAVMICLDNSEFARNADYAPSRLEAQTDAANLISGAKTQAHPENVVGVALMSGERVEVKLNPCTDIGKVLSVLASVGVAEGSETCDLIRSIQTCSIALKHRQNKNQKQRLICFIASPLVGVSEKQLEQVGKVLKKNNVAIDVVSIGDTENVNRERLQKLVEVADSSANPCRFVEVESNSGKHLSDVIVSSPILGGGSSSGGADMLSGGVGFDANMDPELAMAIRLSMEEERQRQSAAVVAGTDQPSASSSSQIVVEEDFDAELRAALLASLQEVAPPAPQVVEANVDEELRKALQESAEDWEGDKEPKKAKTSEAAASGEEEQLLASLPGVDMSDPRIQEALKKNNKKSTQ